MCQYCAYVLTGDTKAVWAAAGTAALATNIGNEHGQILMSVLTAAEGAGLTDMAASIINS